SDAGDRAIRLAAAAAGGKGQSAPLSPVRGGEGGKRARGIRVKHARPSTPEGEHRPGLLAEGLAALDPNPGEVGVDGTGGWAGHAVELLRRVGPAGRLVGLDLDADNLPRARARLEPLGGPFTLHHGNFAGLPAVLAAAGVA